MKLSTVLGACFVLLSAWPATSGAEVSVSARADRSVAGVGEQFRIIVQVVSTDGTASGKPVVTAPEGVTLGPPTDQTSNEMRWVNGQMSQRSTITYIYPAYAMKEGTYRFEDIHVIQDGNKIPAGSVEVMVSSQGAARTAPSQPNAQVPPRTQTGSSVQLVAEFSRDEAYRNQQVLLKLSLISDGELRGQIDFDNLDANIFRGFYQQDVTVEPTQPEPVTIDGKQYIRYEIKRYALFPLTTGELTIPPISMSLITGRTGFFGFGGGRRIRLASKAVTLTVKPLPEEGRPEGFRDAVGAPLGITASLGRKEVRLGDAVSFTVTLQGEANFATLPAPELPPLKSFAIHDPEVSTDVTKAGGKLSGRKTWQYVLVPEATGEIEIPPLHYSVFNPEREVYQTLETSPATLTVLDSGRPREDRIVLRGAGGKQREVTLEGEDFRYIITGADKIEDHGRLLVTSPPFLALNAIPVIVVGFAFYFEKRRKRLENDPAYARRVHAPWHAKEILTRAERIKQADRDGEFDALLTKAMVEFLDMRFGIPARGMLSGELRQRLEEGGIDDELADRVTAFLAELDESRFAKPEGAGRDTDGRLERARDIIQALEGISRR